MKYQINVKKILIDDGVYNNDFKNFNLERINLYDILKNKNKIKKSWSKKIIDTENNSATLICQYPKEGNRLHYHSDWNEWWIIIQGKWLWEIDNKKIEVKKGDIILIKKNKKHKITAIGNKPAIRLAVSRQDVRHIYED